MPRSRRISVDGALYLLTVGGALEPLFRDPQDYDAYLKLLAEHKARYGFRLFAYCLLPQEISLCLEPRHGTTVSSIMHDLTAAYTRDVNKRYARTGPLFRERFKETVVEKASSLAPLTVYLHTLPLQAEVAQDVLGYPYSSARRYCAAAAGTDQLDMETEMREVLSLLPGAPTAAAYAAHLSHMSQDERESLRRLFTQRVVGSEAFVSLVEARLRRACVTALPSSGQVAQRPGDHDAAMESAEPSPARPRHLALVCASLAAVVFSGGVVASLHQRIGGLQQTIAALAEENEASFRTRYSLAVQHEAIGELASLEGTEWDVRLMPMYAQGAEAIRQDQLAFTRRQVSSAALARQGFSTANYTIAAQPDGTLNWETMQTNPSGELVSWQGEWRGPVMRGVVTRRITGKTSEHFTFVAVARKPAAIRSET